MSGQAQQNGSKSENPLQIVDLNDPNAQDAIRAACLDRGYFYVVNHGVNQDLVQSQFRQSKAFFALSDGEKNKVEANADSRGYTSKTYQTLDPKNSSHPDTLEGFWAWLPDVKAGSPEASLPYAGPNLWPDAQLLPGFQETMKEYMETVVRLSQRVRKLLAQALQLPPDFFEQYFQHPLSQLRLVHYTGPESDPAKGIFGAGAHSDWGFLTILADGGTPGLQVEHQGKWSEVTPVPNAYTVHVGDMLQFWSNGTFKSARHRFIKPSGDRYACAFYSSADHDAVIKCLPTCVKDKAQYEPTSVSDYLAMKYKQMKDEQPAAKPQKAS